MVTDVGDAQRVIIGTRDVESSGGVLTEVGLVTWRSLVKLTRTPVLLFFSLFMPLIWLVMFSQAFGTLFSLAGPTLPYDYVAVLLPGITVMTAIQSASQSGFAWVPTSSPDSWTRSSSRPSARAVYSRASSSPTACGWPPRPGSSRA